MSFADLTHSPEFDLPSYGPGYPDDVLNLIECHHEGLYRVVVSKMHGRNKYEQIAAITCQQNATRKKHPMSTAEEIAEYAMCCIQHDIEVSDVRGVYRVTVHGPPGKGSFNYSKHIDLQDADSDAKSISMLSEGELVEQQGAYIGELHGQIIACIETVQGVVKPLMTENKEMMKVVAESQRRLAEVEQIRLNHDLQLKMHNDEIAANVAEEENKMERWKELASMFKDSGAASELLNGLIRKFMNPKSAIKALAKEAGLEPDKKEDDGKEAASPSSDLSAETGANDAPSGGRKKKRKKKKGAGDAPMDPDEKDREILEDAMERVGNNPLVMAAEALKMSIDEKRQWKILYKTLTDDQGETFDEIFGAKSDDDIRGHVNKLVGLDGIEKLLDLNKALDEQQQKFVKLILGAVE